MPAVGGDDKGEGRGGGGCEQMGGVVTWRGLERRAAVEVDSAN